MRTKLLKQVRRKYWIIYDIDKSNHWFILVYKSGERKIFHHAWQFLLWHAQHNMSTSQWCRFFSKCFKRFDTWCDENGKSRIGEGVTKAYLDWLKIS